MYRLQLLQPKLLGGYKKRIIASGGRYGVWLGADAMPFFENIRSFWVAWVENKIGERIIFSPIETEWATKTTPIIRGQGMIIGIPEAYRKWMGLGKGSVVKITYIELEDKIGFMLDIND